MREKSDAARSAPRAAAERERSEAIRSELGRRGISDEFARAIAQQLEPFAADLAAEQLDAVLSGVALAYGVHRRSIDAFRRTVTELEEVQVLLGSFGSELRKLDEAVEILAAYAARLRQHTTPPPPRSVH
jgi:hypothetical protein